MLTMLRNDLVKHPPPGGSVGKAALSKAKADLETSPLEPFTEGDMKEVRNCKRAFNWNLSLV